MITDAELDRLERLCEEATPEPWVATHSSFVYWCVTSRNGWINRLTMAEDAKFIAESRTALPRLIAEIRRLRKEPQ